MRSAAFIRILCTIVVAACLTSARAQHPGASGLGSSGLGSSGLGSSGLGSSGPGTAQTRLEEDQPERLFNDRLRKFKFDLEHVVATAETAEVFLLRYRQSDNPRILGAYPDPHANALVVVGPPEAEQAVREHLAQILVDAHRSGGTSLPLQLRLLQQERQDRFQILAGLETEQAEAAADGGAAPNQAAKSQQLADRLQIIEREVQLLERQIEIVRKYLDRASREPAATQ